jgi:hypothetical protein
LINRGFGRWGDHKSLLITEEAGDERDSALDRAGRRPCSFVLFAKLD